MSRSWQLPLSLAMLAWLPAASIAQPAVPVYQLSWGSAGTNIGQFNQPEGVAVDHNGNVYVADNNNNRVQKFDAAGNRIYQLSATNPLSVAVDRNDFLYVINTGGFFSGSVAKFDAGGGFVTFWNAGFSPTAVTVDDSDNVYVVSRPDTAYVVQKYTNTGTPLLQWRYGRSMDLVPVPNAITVDANFHVFAIDVGNKQVRAFNTMGGPIGVIGSPGSGNGQFQTPHGVATDTFGNVYVTDWSLFRVQIFNSILGGYVGQWKNFTPNPPPPPGTTGPSLVGLYQPEGIAVGPQGDVYVSEWGSRRISRFSGAGLALVSGVGVEAYTWGAGFIQQPFGVAAAPGGLIFVADQSSNRIDDFLPDGVPFTSWGSAGTGNGQFNGPTGIARANSGNLYVTDTGNNRVQEFTVSGNYVAQWGSPGAGNGQFNVPFGIALDGPDTVDVVDQGNNRIQQFSGAGVFRTAWGSAGSGGGQFSAPYGIAIDANHNAYVADAGNNRIQKFTAGGALVTQWGGLGSGNGQFDGPHAVAVDAAGNVYVGDQGNNRIQKFTSAGAYLAQWPVSGLPLPPPAQRSSSVTAAGVDGLAVDAAGSIYFADGVHSHLTKYVSPPAITSIHDVPGDSGYQVTLRIHSCSTDAASAEPQVTGYQIYRSVDLLGTSWDLAYAFPSTGASEYLVRAATLVNAQAGGGGYTLFKVRAITSYDPIYFDSAPGYGYSIDNGVVTPVGVPVPKDQGLALLGARPNPTLGGPLDVEFTLAKSAPAALELFDLAGRRIAAEDVGSLGAGPHVVELAPAHRLATGVYLVRLKQGASSRVVRATVLN